MSLKTKNDQIVVLIRLSRGVIQITSLEISFFLLLILIIKVICFKTFP